MSLMTEYEIDEQLATISEDGLSAYAVISNAYIPGSVKVIADGLTVAWESEDGVLFNAHGPFERASSNGLNALGRNEVNRKTWEVDMAFLKPVETVQVQFFYMMNGGKEE